MKIAVVGGGVAGLGAAWMLGRGHQVVLYEAADYLGGHANTVDAAVGDRRIPVDTGFLVYNEPNYPNLSRLFAALDVETVASDMSFALSIGGGQLEYAGSAGGLIAQPGNLLKPDYWRMLRDLLRFYREAPAQLAVGQLLGLSLGEVLMRGGYSDAFARYHLLPMGAAIWSSPVDDMLDFPAATFVRFFENHALLSLGERPAWRSVLGGSRSYVAALVRSFRGQVRLGVPVWAVRRSPAGVFVRDASGHEERFDQLVLASHGDQALAILGDDATVAERAILGAFRYQENRAVLHRDPALMPRRRRVWSSWNYMAEHGADGPRALAVSYWLNRLQKLDTNTDIFVTLNPFREPDPDRTFAAFSYRHPQFDQASLEAQRDLPSIQGADRSWFCGSYCGFGFHEDGLQAGLGVAAALGSPASWARDITPRSPALVAVTPAAPAMAAE